MDDGTLGAALEREHREIDEGIDAFRSRSSQDGDPIASLTRAMAALRRHIYLEEEFLFPAMRTELAIPTMVMLREHGEIWETMDALEAKLQASGGDDAAALEVCDELMAQLEKHNAKEEPIFYAQADTTLSASDNAQLQAFVASGQMPNGWRCERVRA